jgi:hypothetical protein
VASPAKPQGAGAGIALHVTAELAVEFGGQRHAAMQGDLRPITIMSFF